MNETREIVICGLDGVLALIEHRLPLLYDEMGVKQWNPFLAACTEDMPNLPLIDRLNQARSAGVPIIIITGRSAAVRPQTEAWLAQWEIGHDALWMRPERDFGPALKFKQAIIEQHYHGLPIRRFYESVRHLDIARWCEEQMIPCTLIGPNQGNGESREQLELKVIRHSCEHRSLYPFYGDDDFAWQERAGQLTLAPCFTCQAAEFAEERRQKSSEAKLAARERGLPPLEGSERQVEWAEGIRLTAFSAIEKVQLWMERVGPEAQREDPDHWQTVTRGIERATEWLEEQVEAKWWIDHRHGIMNNLDGGRALLSAVAEQQGYF